MQPLAVLTSDWHLQHLPPSARAEQDWYAVMARAINEVLGLAKKLDVPTVIAGDVFETWKPPKTPCELLSFALDILQHHTVIGVPGNHELPDHKYDQAHRSPYGVLVKAGRIIDLVPGLTEHQPGLIIHGFPFGFDIKPITRREAPGLLDLAVVHQYIWRDGFCYLGAPEEEHASKYVSKLEGFHAAVFGDNHKGFMLGANVINTGTLVRRRTDEKPYQPMIGVLYDDGHIEPHYLDTSEDAWLDDAVAQEKEREEIDASGVIDELKVLGQDSLDFRQAVREQMSRENVREGVRREILGAVE